MSALEIGPLSQSAQDPEKVSSICAVLAETDVINMVSRGIATAIGLRAELIERAKARRPQGRDLGPGIVLAVVDAIGQRRVEVGRNPVGLAVDPADAIVG